MKFVYLFLLICVTLYACHDNQKIAENSNQKLFRKTDPLSLLTKADTVIMEQAELIGRRTEQLSSNDICAKTWTLFDKNEKIVRVRNVYYCKSDTRTTWSSEVYFDQRQKVILEISFDANLKVIYVDHNENPST